MSPAWDLRRWRDDENARLAPYDDASASFGRQWREEVSAEGVREWDWDMGPREWRLGECLLSFASLLGCECSSHGLRPSFG